MRVIVNGKACIVPDNATPAQLRSQLGSELGKDQLLLETTGGTKPVDEGDRLEDGATLWSIPPIIKGTVPERLSDELQLLERAAGGRSKIILGTKTIGKRRYWAVLVKNVRLSYQKFRTTKTDMLFLLPEEYPRLPPVGCYLNYKWPTADHHFTLQSYYDAPFLAKEGWYWYCVGLGGGFNRKGWAHRWRPGTQANNGHNLATLFVAARHAINSE